MDHSGQDLAQAGAEHETLSAHADGENEPRDFFFFSDDGQAVRGHGIQTAPRPADPEILEAGDDLDHPLGHHGQEGARLPDVQAPDRRTRSDAENDLPGIVLVEVIIGRARDRPEVDDHRLKKPGHSLGDGPFVGVRTHGHVDAGQPGHLCAEGTGRVDDGRGCVFPLICPEARYPAACDYQARYLFVEPEFGAEAPGPSVKGMDGEKGRGISVVGRQRPSDESVRVEVGNGLEELLPVEPVDAESLGFLEGEKPFQASFLLLAISDERVAALAPFDFVPVPFFPGSKDIKAAEGHTDLGRVGMGCPEAADGPLVRPLAHARELIDDEGPEARLGQVERCGRPDASRADDDNVE